MVWTLITGYLVMFMQLGFALVETGFTRAKNAAHTMGMNIMIYAIGMMGFWVAGFAFMFGGVGQVENLDMVANLNNELTKGMREVDGAWNARWIPYPKVKMEKVTSDNKADTIVETIVRNARTAGLGLAKFSFTRWWKSSASALGRLNQAV